MFVVPGRPLKALTLATTTAAWLFVVAFMGRSSRFTDDYWSGHFEEWQFQCNVLEFTAIGSGTLGVLLGLRWFLSPTPDGGWGRLCAVFSGLSLFTLFMLGFGGDLLFEFLRSLLHFIGL